MATGFRHSGKRIPVSTASAGMTSGLPQVQEGFQGIGLNTVLVGAGNTIDTEGVWYMPVPATTVKGDKLYVPGAPATEAVNIALTKTAASNTLFGRAVTDRDAAGFAEVLLAGQMAAVAA